MISLRDTIDYLKNKKADPRRTGNTIMGIGLVIILPALLSAIQDCVEIQMAYCHLLRTFIGTEHLLNHASQDQFGLVDLPAVSCSPQPVDYAGVGVGMISSIAIAKSAGFAILSTVVFVINFT